MAKHYSVADTERLIAIVDREIARREKALPPVVLRKQLSPAQAQSMVQDMKDVRAYLVQTGWIADDAHLMRVREEGEERT